MRDGPIWFCHAVYDLQWVTHLELHWILTRTRKKTGSSWKFFLRLYLVKIGCQIYTFEPCPDETIPSVIIISFINSLIAGLDSVYNPRHTCEHRSSDNDRPPGLHTATMGHGLIWLDAHLHIITRWILYDWRDQIIIVLIFTNHSVFIPPLFPHRTKPPPNQWMSILMMEMKFGSKWPTMGRWCCLWLMFDASCNLSDAKLIGIYSCIVFRV